MSTDEPEKKLSVAGPLIGLVISVCLFVAAMVPAILSMFIGPWNGTTSPFITVGLLAPVVGFMACLIWLVTVVIQKRSDK